MSILSTTLKVVFLNKDLSELIFQSRGEIRRHTKELKRNSKESMMLHLKFPKKRLASSQSPKWFWIIRMVMFYWHLIYPIDK